MKTKTLLFGICCALPLGCASTSPSTPAPNDDVGAAASNTLIPREALFGNPTRTRARLSPDGEMLSWLAPKDGVLNVWVAPRGNVDAAKVITKETSRPIRLYFWSQDSKHVLFINDSNGDENFLLYAADPRGNGESRLLTPFEKTRVRMLGMSKKRPEHVLIGVNNRDPRYHDAHVLNLSSGEMELVFKNEGGYGAVIADDDFVVRAVLKDRKGGGNDFFRVGADGKVEADPFSTVTGEDSLTSQPLGFNAAGDTLYWRDSRGRDKAALIAQTWSTGELSVLAKSDKADIDRVEADPVTGEPQAAGSTYLKTEWQLIGDAIAKDFELIGNKLTGDWQLSSRTTDDTFWIVGENRAEAPYTYYLYDRNAGALTELFVTRPELAELPLQPMHGVEIATRDGFTLTAYLTLPASADGDADGVADNASPMVLNVHGGPWARDTYGFNSEAQWLANRGYAVLQVNFRGSTGFGKAFINASNLEWGSKMHNDLLDAVEWAVSKGITTANQVAIYGGSYGGYATLAGLTFTPETFSCGVDIVGPSNLDTLLASIPPYWESLREEFYVRVGDARTDEGKALLKERSPLFHVDKITKPLLIAQGANDPRVKQAESDQIVAAMKAKKIPVTYVLYPDEGHGFARPANRLSFYAITEQFLGNCLGGLSEPIPNAFAGASLTVPEGAEVIPGLAEATIQK
ncbi:MAG: S9 family peptidase [Myxococcota bacterium]